MKGCLCVGNIGALCSQISLNLQAEMVVIGQIGRRRNGKLLGCLVKRSSTSGVVTCTSYLCRLGCSASLKPKQTVGVAFIQSAATCLSHYSPRAMFVKCVSSLGKHKPMGASLCVPRTVALSVSPASLSVFCLCPPSQQKALFLFKSQLNPHY